jgi:hypothetical protein
MHHRIQLTLPNAASAVRCCPTKGTAHGSIGMKISNRQPHRSRQDQDSLRSHLQVSHDRIRDHRHRVEVLESVFDGLDGWKRTYVDLPGHGNSPPLHSLRRKTTCSRQSKRLPLKSLETHRSHDRIVAGSPLFKWLPAQSALAAFFRFCLLLSGILFGPDELFGQDESKPVGCGLNAVLFLSGAVGCGFGY